MLRLIAIAMTPLVAACAQTHATPQHSDVEEVAPQQIPWEQLPPAQQAAIGHATAWFKSKELDQISATWQHHFAKTSACTPYLTLLEEPPQTRVEGGHAITEPASHEGWWLLTDLETNRFWLLVTMDYFGAAYYFGPARLTPAGDLEPVTDLDQPCVH